MRTIGLIRVVVSLARIHPPRAYSLAKANRALADRRSGRIKGGEIQVP